MRLTARVLPLLVLLVVLAQVAPPRPAQTLPLYAARQGLMCQTCHFDPNGGGPRNEFGFAFAKSRHELEPETTGPWKDLQLTNRVSESMPVYFGLNQRLMLLANTTARKDSLDRLGFFNMENALYVVFQPHSRLTLVYDRDGFDAGSTTKDAFGLIGGFPANGYLKAGRIRTPFGLRMDDHTVATRGSFLYFESARSFLPYDPLQPDMGVEVGADHGPFFGRAAFTNGASYVLGPEPFADAVTVKLGYSHARGQAAISLYDDYVKGDNAAFKRATRWDLYALTHWQRFALVGELGAGTDREPGGARLNLLAGFVEANYAVSRAVNLRVRYDQFQGDRDLTLIARPNRSLVTRRDLATYQRYALEGEFLPVPFAELRWTLRLIDPKARADALGFVREKEKQAFLQVHFSY